MKKDKVSQMWKDKERARHRLSEQNRETLSVNEKLQEENARLKSELDLLKKNCHQAALKYRDVTATQIPELKSKLDEMHCLHRASHKRELELKSQLALERALRIEAEMRVEKVRSTISFQLGYALIHAKSIRKIIGLPFELIRIKKESERRMKKVVLREQSLSPVMATAAAAPETPPQRLQATDSIPATRAIPALDKSGPLRSLKVACVMDDFTYGSYFPECRLQQLTPDAWKVEIESFKPELLFIESAWRGKDEKWGSKVGHNSQELKEIVLWCNHRDIPTVFWNKEDPVHFETFLTTAQQFDYIFTTDLDCIHRYKAALGHDRAYFLPFACQPVSNNPIEKYERKDAFCFAGAYYARYPERTKDLENFVFELPEYKPFEIYDRNYGKTDSNYQFPEMYHPYIVGTLPFDQIDKAYKGYRYAINLNSIKQSQTMFARRVFELLASNTVTVSNYSRGVRLMFGDLVATSDSGKEIVHRLSEAEKRDPALERMRLAALRKVMSEHTYANRLAYLVSKVSGHEVTIGAPLVAVVAVVEREKELKRILACYNHQTYAVKQLKVLFRGNWKTEMPSASGSIMYYSEDQVRDLVLGDIAGTAKHVVLMVAADYYGPNYLQDLILAMRYSNGRLIGKGAYYEQVGTLTRRHPDLVYRSVQALSFRSCMVTVNLIRSMKISHLMKEACRILVQDDSGLSIDPFNYCRNCTDIRSAAKQVDDLNDLNCGLSLSEFIRHAEQVAPAEEKESAVAALMPSALNEMIIPRKNTGIAFALDGMNLRVESTLADGKHEYIYGTKEFLPSELGYDGEVSFYLETTPGLNLQWVVLFLDAYKQRISAVVKPSNCNVRIPIPAEAEFLRFGLRVYAAGSACIKRLALGLVEQAPPHLITGSEVLLVTNNYPSYEDLYRNGFVHSRINAYRERGVGVDVFRVNTEERISYHEFKNSDVMSGSVNMLCKILECGRYRHILVHFLDASMWDVLKKYVHEVKITVWIHGAEIHPWWRRSYNFETEAEKEKAKANSEIRMGFWRALLQIMPENLELVFVSNYFAEEVMEDLGFKIPENKFHVIHNPIDTRLFNYKEKTANERMKILSIRPFASRQYANDLTVKAILELSKRPFFKELDFLIVGDGRMFESLTSSLNAFENVRVERKFLTQPEIAQLHKEFGIFLCPSRWDSHGVSRDEAMSSGMVPITTAVAAIPEFVDETCGMVVQAEDWKSIADAVETLYLHPELFISLSCAAHERVERQTAASRIIPDELGLFVHEGAGYAPIRRES